MRVGARVLGLFPTPPHPSLPYTFTSPSPSPSPRSQAELKHARVCMLATLGWVAVDLGFTMPEAPKVSSLAAHDVTVWLKIPELG